MKKFNLKNLKLVFSMIVIFSLVLMPSLTQEAFAVATVNSVVTNTSTQITITFSENIGTEGGVNLPADWTVGGVTPQAVTDESGGGTTTLVLTMSTANAFATDALPTVVYTDPGDNTVIESTVDNVDIVVNQAATDGAPPTFVSAITTSATTIAITFSEDIDDNSEADDFTIGGVAGGTTITTRSVAGSVLTITTNGYSILPGETVTVTFDGEADDLEDTGTLNDVADFGPSAVTNSLVASVTAPPGGSGSASKSLTRPTFGIDHNTFIQTIEGGFSFNGVSHDIIDNFWTPFAEQEVKVGQTNSFTIKAFADKKLKVIEFLFGIPEVGEANKAELGVEIHYDIDGEIKEIKAIQKSDVIKIDSVKVTTSESKCRSDDKTSRCITTHLSMKFLEPLQDKVMALKAIDFKNRAQTTYLNEGFDVSGDSLNPMNTKLIPGTVKYEGLIEITQTAKYSDIWAANDGRDFEINEFGTVKQINQLFERHTDTGVMRDRMHSEFAKYKETQADIAVKELLVLCPNCLMYYADFKDPFSYEFPETNDRINDPELQKNLMIESEKAQKIMEYLLDPTLYRFQ